ncbi:hypothetical protein [Sporosarcina sp. A2]|uniref:hypothetical protein n=1 Tax=Sporosarcina sp. A2 TaxID=3393449 RepID=UPI003D7BF092
MKRTFGLFIILFTLLLASCAGVSIASSLMVIEKGYSSDNNEHCIMAYDPNNHNKEEPFKIVIQEKMVWNLIEKDIEYFARYSKNGDSPSVLEDIQY